MLQEELQRSHRKQMLGRTRATTTIILTMTMAIAHGSNCSLPNVHGRQDVGRLLVALQQPVGTPMRGGRHGTRMLEWPTVPMSAARWAARSTMLRGLVGCKPLKRLMPLAPNGSRHSRGQGRRGRQCWCRASASASTRPGRPPVDVPLRPQRLLPLVDDLVVAHARLQCERACPCEPLRRR